MAFWDWLRGKKSGRSRRGGDGTDPESLWESLCENPNQERELRALLAECERRAGHAGAVAMLEELAGRDGAVLPGKLLQEYNQELGDVYSDAFRSRVPDEEMLSLDIPADDDEAEFGGGRRGAPSGGNVALSAGQILFDDGVEDPSLHPYLFAMDVPVYGALFGELAEYLPLKKPLGRIGLYSFSFTGSDAADVKSAAPLSGMEIAVGLPILLAEHVFFCSRYAPTVLCPVKVDGGICDNRMELDGNILEAICSQHKLEYLVAGSVMQLRNSYAVRVTVYHRIPKSLRNVMMDIPISNPDEKFLRLFREVSTLLSEKGEAPMYFDRAALAYSVPDQQKIVGYAKRDLALLYGYLLHKSYCTAQLRDAQLQSSEEAANYLASFEEILALVSKMSVAEPENVLSCLKLLSAMYMARKANNAKYLSYRSGLYHSADKNRQSPVIRSVAKRIDALLRDPGRV